MELEFCKHFKDATNLLLMMDHDSGYVEGAEMFISSSNESEPAKESGARPYNVPENFPLNEDALLEKPDTSLDFGDNKLSYHIDLKEYEESRNLFFSPEIISGSVPSVNTTAAFSGLENETSSECSMEIPLKAPIVVNSIETSAIDSEGTNDNDVLMITATESDMSLEETFDPIIIENKNIGNSNDSITSPLKGFALKRPNLEESAISKCVAVANYFIPNNEEEIIQADEKSIEEVLIKSPTSMEPDSENEPNKEIQPVETAAGTSKPRLTLIFSKSDVENGYSVKRKYPSMTPDKNIQKPVNPSISPDICGDDETENTQKSYFEIQTQDNKLPSTQAQTEEKYVDKLDQKLLKRTQNSMSGVLPLFSKSDVENGYSVKRKYPSMTPDKNIQKPVNPSISPDIFGDDETENTQKSYFEIQTQDNKLPSTQAQTEEKYVDKLDQKLLKRTQNSMSGVLPPPGLTVSHLSIDNILLKLEENKKFFFWDNENVAEKKQDSSLDSSSESNKFSKSLLLSVDLEEAKDAKWPGAFNMRCHGLHYNCNKVSEEIVDLCDKYQKRFVGAETQSSCTVFEVASVASPSKRRMAKARWGVKSPGRRLSHLARRRITFSSANLQAASSSLAGSRARQILVDAKKIDLLSRRRSPRKSPRKTPRKTPKKTPNRSPKVKTRTPSSSAKKKLALRFRKLTGELEKSVPSTSGMTSVQRALFKSPDKGSRSESSKNANRNSKRALFQSPKRDGNSSLLVEDKTHLRRALFASPKKNSPMKGKKSPLKRLGFEKKRKRSESDDAEPVSKLPRSMSMDVRPNTSTVDKSLTRAHSELNISLNRSQSQTELSEQHKKKLLWAVSAALQSQKITNAHPQWKSFASVLARVTRRFFINQMAASGAKPEGGTSERMQRIALRHVISVIKGKTAEEIVSEYLKTRTKVQRPQGYVAPEDYSGAKVMKAPSGGKENVFQDRVNTIQSWEKKKLELMFKPSTTENRIERIRKVINFGDDR